MTKKIDFTEVVEVVARGVKAQTKAQWDVGDALIRAVGGPTPDGRNDGSSEKLEACSEELAKHGFEYSPNTLRNLRLMAHIYPKKRRHLDLSFGVHNDANDPDTLDDIIAKAPQGQKIVQSYVRSVMQARELAHQRKLDKERERRQVEFEKAREEREEAEELARKARTKEEKEEADEKIAAAEQKQRENRVPPTRTDIPKVVPSAEEAAGLIGKLEFDMELSRVWASLNGISKKYDSLIKSLSQDDVDLAVERLDNVILKANQLADHICKKARKIRKPAEKAMPIYLQSIPGGKS